MYGQDLPIMHSILRLSAEYTYKGVLMSEVSWNWMYIFAYIPDSAMQCHFMKTLWLHTASFGKIYEMPWVRISNSPCSTSNIQHRLTALSAKQTHQKLSIVLCPWILIANEDLPYMGCLSISILVPHSLSRCAQRSSTEHAVHHCDLTWITAQLLYCSGTHVGNCIIFLSLNSDYVFLLST